MIKSKLKNLELIIIGEGEDEDYIHEYVKKTGVQNIKFVGKVESEELSHFLAENIDLGFSVGTSAIEFALRRIPSVLVPTATEYEYFSKQNEKYEWLQNISGYDLCTNERDLKSYKTFESIINCYSKQKEKLKKESSNYVLINHSTNKVGGCLIRILKNCSLSFEDLKEIGINNDSRLGKVPFIFKKFYKELKSG